VSGSIATARAVMPFGVPCVGPVLVTFWRGGANVRKGLWSDHARFSTKRAQNAALRLIASSFHSVNVLDAGRISSILLRITSAGPRLKLWMSALLATAKEQTKGASEDERNAKAGEKPEQVWGFIATKPRLIYQ
jgi:hypothetical protein